MVALYRSGGYIERAIRPFGGGAAGFAQRTGAFRRGSQGPEGAGAGRLRQPARHPPGLCGAGPALSSRQERRGPHARGGFEGRDLYRKGGVQGKSVAVRVESGGPRLIKKKKT